MEDSTPAGPEMTISHLHQPEISIVKRAGGRGETGTEWGHPVLQGGRPLWLAARDRHGREGMGRDGMGWDGARLDGTGDGTGKEWERAV